MKEGQKGGEKGMRPDNVGCVIPLFKKYFLIAHLGPILVIGIYKELQVRITLILRIKI